MLILIPAPNGRGWNPDKALPPVNSIVFCGGTHHDIRGRASNMRSSAEHWKEQTPNLKLYISIAAAKVLILSPRDS